VSRAKTNKAKIARLRNIAYFMVNQLKYNFWVVQLVDIYTTINSNIGLD